MNEHGGAAGVGPWPAPKPKKGMSPVRGSELRRRREMKNWSQRRLAEESGVTIGVIQRSELSSDGAARTRDDNLTALARALGCARGWLVAAEP